MPDSVLITSIDPGERLRVLDPSWVNLLAEEIDRDGLIEPVRVVAQGNRYRLVDGARRLAAHEALGLTEISATLVTAEDEAAIRMAEIKGHLLRGELTALDRAVTVAAWCDIYKQAKGTPKRGPKGKLSVIEGGSDEALEEFSATVAVNWSEAAKAALDLSDRTLFRALKIARIEPELRRRIALLPIAKAQKDLLALASETPTRQAALVDILTKPDAGELSLSDAIALLDALPAPVKRDKVDKIVERFTALDEKEQFKFFDRNADLIEAWHARRARKAG